MNPKWLPRGGFLPRGSHTPRARLNRGSKKFAFARDLIEDQEQFDYESGEWDSFIKYGQISTLIEDF